MIIDRLNWSLLYTYLIIVEEGGISAASLRLNLTQSAISQSLKRLEEQLGIRLIERNNQAFYLTKSGKNLYHTVKRIYNELLQYELTLKQESPHYSGSLNLMIVNGIRSKSFDQDLALFRQTYPNVQLNLKALPNVEIMRYLSSPQPLIAIGIFTHKMPQLQDIYYLPQRYSLYCGPAHPLFKARNIDVQSVLEEDFVIYDSEQLGDALSPIALFRHSGAFSGNIVATTNNLVELMRLIELGYGIGALPDNATISKVKNGQLRKLPPLDGVADIPLHLFWNHKRELKPIEKAFIQLLTQKESAAP